MRTSIRKSTTSLQDREREVRVQTTSSSKEISVHCVDQKVNIKFIASDWRILYLAGGLVELAVGLVDSRC